LSQQQKKPESEGESRLTPFGYANVANQLEQQQCAPQGLQQDLATACKSTAAFWIRENPGRVYREDHRNHHCLESYLGKNFSVKHHFPLENADLLKLICSSSPDFTPDPGHSLLLKRCDAGFRHVCQDKK